MSPSKEDKKQKHQISFKQVIQELHQFFYNHQYDERYVHFRACDLEYEFDYDGNRYDYYCFYD